MSTIIVPVEQQKYIAIEYNSNKLETQNLCPDDVTRNDREEPVFSRENSYFVPINYSSK